MTCRFFPFLCFFLAFCAFGLAFCFFATEKSQELRLSVLEPSVVVVCCSPVSSPNPIGKACKQKSKHCHLVLVTSYFNLNLFKQHVIKFTYDLHTIRASIVTPPQKNYKLLILRIIRVSKRLKNPHLLNFCRIT